MISITLLAALILSRIVVTEVMSNPAGADGARYPEDRNEFVEVYNAGSRAVDLFNYRISDGDAEDVIRVWTDSSILIRHPNVLIGTTWLKPGGYAVILDPEYTDPEGQGGFIQPYRFADSTLILTVGNTTIGNGLAVNDPVLIYGYEDTTTFGTPDNLNDGFPFNPGDGYSWERIDINGPDAPDNWAVCPDSAGCTPGGQNAVAMRVDVALTRLEILDTIFPGAGEAFRLGVGVCNQGYVSSPPGNLQLLYYPEEPIQEITLPVMSPRQESLFVFEIEMPSVPKEIWARVLVPGDRDTANNIARITVNPNMGTALLMLQNPSFSPDGDGFEDSLLIRYRLPEPGGRLRMRIFTLGARMLRTLVDTKAVSETLGIIYWDGRQDNGQLAPAGIYLVVLDYYRGNARLRSKLPVVLIRRQDQRNFGVRM
ncbi:MAG: lamin tail domain-containing protein [candidate division WOR-3 bacterium]